MKKHLNQPYIAKLQGIVLTVLLMMGILAIPGASAESNAGVDSICGFLWADGSGTSPTCWDGLYNGGESPLPGYTVSLYAADNLANPIATVQTDAGGKYIFKGLAPGSYVLGVASAVINGYEYLLPMAAAGQNKFAIDWSSEPLTAYTDVIALAAGQAVEGIDAGMRLPMGIVPTANIALANLGSANKNDTVTIDSRTWVVVKKQTVGSGPSAITCVYLIMRGYIYDNMEFGPSTNYDAPGGATATLRNRMKKILDDKELKTIQAIAVKPNLGSPHSSDTVLTSPIAAGDTTVVMAGTATQDILFAPSYGDIREWINGNTTSSNTTIPSGHPLHNDSRPSFPGRFWCRTSSGAYVTGVLIRHPANGSAVNSLDKGIQIQAMYTSDVPAVWVNAGAVIRKVTVYYVDTNGDPIPGAPVSKTYDVTINDTFTAATLTSSEVPPISGYKYKEWRKGSMSATPTGGLPTGTILSADEVIAGTSIYLIYEQDVKTDVTITKTVAGDYADRTKTYEFTLTFRNSGNVLLPTNTQFTYTGGVITGSGATAPSGGTLTLTNGVGKIYLKHGQAITIKNVLSTDQIQIAETPQGGYIPSYKDSADPSGTSISSNDTGPKTVDTVARTFGFTNTRNPAVAPPTGIGEDFRGFAALLSVSVLLLLSGAAIAILKRKRIWTRAG